MFKLFITVIDSYVQRDYLVVVSDIDENSSHCADYRDGETVELHLPDGSKFTAPSKRVLFDPPAERPFCMAFRGLRRNDVPLGTQIWISEERPARRPSRHYEARNDESPNSIL